MVFVVLILITSFGCLLVSLIILGLVLYQFHSTERQHRPSRYDEVIVISGCDSGIGLELAKYCFKTFKFQIICGFLDTSSDGFKQLSQLAKSSIDLADDAAHSSGRLVLKKLDITLDDDIKSVVTVIKELKENGSSIVALVNNAGALVYGEFDWLTREQIRRMINVNIFGTMDLTREILPYLIESKGRIINVSSVNDATVFPGISVYSGTKSFISTFSRGLGYELRKFGAHVVTIRLGDFARLTNIMAQHSIHRDDMWREMSEKKKDQYSEYFPEFNRHLMDNYGMTSPKGFEESSLFEDFSRALLSKQPPNTITCAPLQFRLFYFFIELTPTWIQYHLLDLMIRIGFRWRQPQIKD